ncbi:MAG: TIM barrel protein [Anaerolineae bacterium]|nr:TIM barrel protein [Anaerolineae bacterium]
MIKPAETSLATFVAKVAELGFDAIELWSRDETFGEAVALARQHDLAIAIMSGHDSLTVGLNDPAQHDRIEAELRTSIDLAADVGIPGVIVFSGNRREGVPEAEAMAATVAGLRRIASYAEAKNVNLNMELLNSKVDHPGYQCDHSVWGIEICKQVNSPNVKLLFDIYHMQIMEGDVIRTIRDNIRWIGHFHTAGVPGRRDFDDTQELNYTGICRAIAETGYNLFVGHEFKPKGDVYEALAQAHAICDQGKNVGTLERSNV